MVLLRWGELTCVSMKLHSACASCASARRVPLGSKLRVSLICSRFVIAGDHRSMLRHTDLVVGKSRCIRLTTGASPQWAALKIRPPACPNALPHCLERLVAVRRWLSRSRKVLKQVSDVQTKASLPFRKLVLCLFWPPLDRAHHCVALKDLMQCGDQHEREKRCPIHLKRLTNHSIHAARWRCESTV